MSWFVIEMSGVSHLFLSNNVNSCYHSRFNYIFGPLLSTVAAFFNPPLLKFTIDPNKAALLPDPFSPMLLVSTVGALGGGGGGGGGAG